MKRFSPLIIWFVFIAIAVVLWQALGNALYLFNFAYIGTCVSVGIYLTKRKIRYARNVILLAIGSYMLVYLGFILRENMQIEGFWYYLFLGVFEAAVIHYAVAKIFGPLLFGRGWCGYACWTAMVLDLLPHKLPRNPRKRAGYIRYILFAAALVFMIILLYNFDSDLSHIMFLSFIVGNIAYYFVGIVLAFALKDNRAFCKYICPIAVFLKATSYFALTRVKVDPEKCSSCGRCKKVCPMDVDMTNNSRKRTNGTECILCSNCIKECKNNALHL